MKESLRPLLISELLQASSYQERLWRALSEITKQDLTKVIHNNISNLLAPLNLPWNMSSNQNLSGRLELQKFHQLLENIFTFIDLDSELESAVKIINEIYQNAHTLHQQIIADSPKTEIVIPRCQLLQAKKNPVNALPIFFLELEDFESLALSDDDNQMVNALNFRREDKYLNFFEQAQKLVSNKKMLEAIPIIREARRFKDTPMIITLEAWCQFALGKSQIAQSLCLKAIELDPEYGPAYNDLGSYLLEEDKLDDALKLFAKAKRATFFPQREYPYINCGRVYLKRNDFKNAREEFIYANLLSPDRPEILRTLEMIQKNLEVYNQYEHQSPNA
jgi:tetratricopeptide (TPR) repeat protein